MNKTKTSDQSTRHFQHHVPLKKKYDLSRNALKMFMCIFSIYSFTLAPLRAQAKKQIDRPNVLFIASDDLNDWVSTLRRHPQVKTPNIDRLTERGTLFTNAHTQAPLCNPSRVSIMTGLRPSTTGIYGLAPGHRDVDITKKIVTLPQFFAEHGYQTLSAGKVFHGSTSNIRSEFQEWGPSGGHDPFPEQKLVEEPLDMVQHPLVDWGVFPKEGDSLLTDYKVATWAVEQLEQLGTKQKEQPFFMAVGFSKPHVPLYAAQKWFDLYPEEEIVLPPAPEGDRDDVPDFAWYLN